MTRSMLPMPMSTSNNAAACPDPDALSGTGLWALPAQRLAEGIDTLGLGIEPQAQQKMLGYLALLAHWSRAYNLTAVTEPMAMVDRHLLDSLSIAEWIPKGLAIDAGTGAGLPGIVLAIAGLGEEWILVDGNGKKIRFIRQACRSLGLSQVRPVHGRVESLTTDAIPRVVVARALAPLGQLVEWTRGWLDQGSVLLAMKADLQETELAQVPSSYNVSIRMLKTAQPELNRQLALIGSAEAIERLESKK